MLLTFCRPDSAHLHKRALGVGPCRDGGDGEGDPAPQTAICGPFFSYLERRRRYTRRRERRAVSNVRTWEPDAVTATCRVVPGTARDSLPNAGVVPRGAGRRPEVFCAVCTCWSCKTVLEHRAPPEQTRRTGGASPIHGGAPCVQGKIGPLTRTCQSSVRAEQPIQWESRDPWAERAATQHGWHQHKCDRQCDHALTCLQQLAGRELELRILDTGGHLQRP